MTDLIYLYCIVEPDSEAFAALKRREVQGLDPREPLYPVAAAGLVAAVSRVPANTFDEESLNLLVADLPRLAPYAIAHEQAIRMLLPGAPALIPMTFGAVYHAENGVAALLAEHAADFRRRLDRLRDRQEWEVKVFRRPAELLAAVASTSPRLQTGMDASGASPGRAYLLQRLKQQRLQSEAARMTLELVGAIQDRLQTAGYRTRVEMVESLTDQDAELVCKVAALVERTKTSDFRALTAQMSHEYDPTGLNLELSGPWAAFSFVECNDATD